MTERNPAPGPAPGPAPVPGPGPDAEGAVGAGEESCAADQLGACTVRDVLDRVGGKWSIGIIIAASRGPTRFTELERSVEGISRRMLALTLRNLERDGLLVRTTYPTVPPRVEYVATEMARELYESLVLLTRWAERHRPAIAAARAAYDRRHATSGIDGTAPH
ncbi:winged helix-turn-helix transcriptional regulator [Plantactinospora sp. WMMC1484]|uniref:winged helix-turn-helix transcriptional regulator n=1 Tax=Plantactinospora sp. WMMC1484 TaxID=3404122 RepID=UPI003BF4CE41